MRLGLETNALASTIPLALAMPQLSGSDLTALQGAAKKKFRKRRGEGEMIN
jgi:hypothetical protein